MEIKTSKSGWVTFLVSGLVAITYGLLALLSTEEIMKNIMMGLGICSIVVGLLLGWMSLKRKQKEQPWLPLFLEAIALVVVGVISLIWTKEFMNLLIILVGLWSLLIGILMLIATLKSKYLYNKAFFVISAVLSMVFGVMVMMFPETFGSIVTTITGIIALVFGVIMIMFAFTLHRIDKDVSVEVIESESTEQ